jgi:predicted DCC family thiol-disulfide oxidoreductase YuxK
LCNGGVNFAIDHDPAAKLRFVSLQSNVAKALLVSQGYHPTQTQTIVLFTSKDRMYTSSEAVSKIFTQLNLPLLRLAGYVGQFTPNFVREPLYKFVSSNRHVLGENDQCRMDFDGVYENRFVSDPVVLVDNHRDDDDDDDDGDKV